MFYHLYLPNYLLGKYEKAISAAQKFLDLYPEDDVTPYALYISAQSYFKRIPVTTQDKTLAGKARHIFRELLQHFPSSEYALDAEDKVRIIGDQLAEKEIQVGKYYFGRHNYTSAVNRFKTVTLHYRINRYMGEALLYLVKSYCALGMTDEARVTLALLNQNFPDTQWHREAYVLLYRGKSTSPKSTGLWIDSILRDKK